MINGLKDRMFNMSSSAKKIVLYSAIAVFALTAVIISACALVKSVVIVDQNGFEKEILTIKRCVEDVLKAENIVLDSRDKLNVGLDAKLKDNMKIEIYRAMVVCVEEKGDTKFVVATRRTAGEILEELGYNPKRTDKITPGYDEVVEEFGEISFIRVDEKTITQSEEIPYESKETENKALAQGTQKLVQKGSPGEKTVSYKIVYEDGVEVSREKISEEVKVQPVAQIKEVGPKPINQYVIATNGTVQTSRSGSLAYSKVITANATAYDASSCGKAPSHPAYGITATGMRAGYGIVAVDPRVIPLGSKLYIETADGSYVYGTAIAADTGGAIKGNRIDLCYNTRQEAIQFGRKNVKVYILN